MMSKLLKNRQLQSFVFKRGQQSSAMNTKRQAEFDLPHQFQTHLLEETPKSSGILLSRDEALAYYRNMLMVRRIESAAGNMYMEKKVRGFCHESVGQEASPVGISSALVDGDAVINGYRLHGWAWLMGVSAEQILGELTWRIHGNVHGKGGSMHIYAKNFYGGHGIVGAQISLGVGLAFSKKYKNENFVSVTLYGDGAANQGQFYEAANMASLWKLPVIFVCENNGFGMGTPVHRASASLHMFNRLNFLPGILVDGMDVLAVRQASRWAREYCATGNGPIVLELDTYRFVGHSVGDPGTTYRSPDEVMQVRKTRDPISHFRDKIVAAELVNEDEIKEIDNAVKENVGKAYEMAHIDGELPPDGLYADIYANTSPQWIRGLTHQSSVTQKYTNSEEFMKDYGK